MKICSRRFSAELSMHAEPCSKKRRCKSLRRHGELENCSLRSSAELSMHARTLLNDAREGANRCACAAVRELPPQIQPMHARVLLDDTQQAANRCADTASLRQPRSCTYLQARVCSMMRASLRTAASDRAQSCHCTYTAAS